MIKGLQGQMGITVGAGDNILPYVSANINNPMQGMLRINNTELEVFNGSNWQRISSSYATVSLDAETQDLLLWAKAQRQMALNRMTLAQNNPGLMKALESLKKAEDNFEILAKIVDPEYSNV